MQIAYVLYWWLVLVFIGLISFPLVSRVCGSVEDKGYSLSKIIGLTFLTFISWMISSLKILPFGYANIIVSILILIAVSFFFGRKNLKISEWPRKKILTGELIFTIAFILFVLIQFGKSDISYKGNFDGLFNYAFIQSILRGGYSPVLDPWFAGGSIPYYYGGHYLIAFVTKLTGVPSAVAFNIAMAMFYALAVTVAYGLGYNITKRKRYGLVTALFVCIVGYTSGAFQLAAYATNHTIIGYTPIHSQNIIDWMLNFSWLQSIFLIKGAVTHYAYYSYAMGDMHAYFMSIPFQIAYISLIFAVYKKSRSDFAPSRSDNLLTIVILSVCLGFFFILNTWDFPTYIIFTFLSFIFLKMRPRIRGNLFIPLIITVLGFVLYLPYYLSSRISGFRGLGLVTTELRTSIGSFLEYCVPFLFVVITFLLVFWKREYFAGRKSLVIVVLLLIPIVLLAVFLHFQILVILLPLGLLCLYLLYKSKGRTEVAFILLLIIMAVSLAFFCDFLYIKDIFVGDWARFNTVMKVYHPLWIFLSISAAYGVYYVLRYLKERKSLWLGMLKASWIVILVILLVAALIHPIAMTVSMIGGRNVGWGDGRGTLDGLTYLEKVNKGDYEAIRWLNDNIKGHPVILEMPGEQWIYTSRVSGYTGLPTVIGWQTGYEWAWGRDKGEVDDRALEVDLIYNTSNNSEAIELLQKYDVEYIYIGTLEQNKYSIEGLQKFDSYSGSYELIYQQEGVSIYRLKED